MLKECTMQVTQFCTTAKQNEPSSQADDIWRHKHVAAPSSGKPQCQPVMWTHDATCSADWPELAASGCSELDSTPPEVPWYSSCTAREANSSILLNSLVTSSIVSTLEASEWQQLLRLVLLQLSRRPQPVAEHTHSHTPINSKDTTSAYMCECAWDLVRMCCTHTFIYSMQGYGIYLYKLVS